MFFLNHIFKLNRIIKPRSCMFLASPQNQRAFNIFSTRPACLVSYQKEKNLLSKRVGQCSLVFALPSLIAIRVLRPNI